MSTLVSIPDEVSNRFFSRAFKQLSEKFFESPRKDNLRSALRLLMNEAMYNFVPIEENGKINISIGKVFSHPKFKNLQLVVHIDYTLAQTDQGDEYTYAIQLRGLDDNDDKLKYGTYYKIADKAIRVISK